MSVFGKEAAVAALSSLTQIAASANQAVNGSLIDVTAPLRVEPITLVDNTLVHQEYMGDLMSTLTSVFAAYYMQAVAISNTFAGVRVVDRLAPLSTDRRLATELASISFEDYGLALPSYSLEAGEIDTNNMHKDIMSVQSLAVGKIIEVKLTAGEAEVKVPVTIRLLTNSASRKALTHILVKSSKDKSVKTRWHAWRAGELSFINDLILCQDLIDDYKKTAINDDTGFFTAVNSRKAKNAAISGATKNPSINTASNVIVISSQTAQQVESEIGQRISKFRVRNEIFNETYAMLLAVVDTEWERVTIYHRGIDDPTELSVKELKTAARGTGPDVSEILRAYRMGSAPNL